MLAPKKVKWRKQQKGRMTGLSKGATNVAFGEYGLQALSCGFVTSRQIEAARIAISRHVKRGGKRNRQKSGTTHLEAPPYLIADSENAPVLVPGPLTGVKMRANGYRWQNIALRMKQLQQSSSSNDLAMRE